MLHIPTLYLADIAGKGRGIKTGIELSQDDVIEISPIIKIPEGQLAFIDKTIFYDYYFLWEEVGYRGCIALGYGSLYNHSFDANTTISFDYTDSTIKFYAARDIAPHQELCIDYTGEGLMSDDSLWFMPI